MKKVLIIIVVIAAIVALFVLTKKTTQAPSGSDTVANDSVETGPDETKTPSDTPTEENISNDTTRTPTTETTVTYGPKGFDPKSITIKAGQKVTFVNEGESSMWVASSKHPTHGDYPEKTAKDCLGSAFDECEAVGTGGSYSFTFNKEGSWNYHNHVAPNDWGTVVVK